MVSWEARRRGGVGRCVEIEFCFVKLFLFLASVVFCKLLLSFGLYLLFGAMGVECVVKKMIVLLFFGRRV